MSLSDSLQRRKSSLWAQVSGSARTSEKLMVIPGKVYRILPDPRAAKDNLVRIIDESGEDYLYHKGYFVFVDFPPSVKKRILALQSAA